MFAACCPCAHDFIDGKVGGWDEETKRAEWERAYFETLYQIWAQGKVKVA